MIIKKYLIDILQTIGNAGMDDEDNKINCQWKCR